MVLTDCVRNQSKNYICYWKLKHKYEIDLNLLEVNQVLNSSVQEKNHQFCTVVFVYLGEILHLLQFLYLLIHQLLNEKFVCQKYLYSTEFLNQCFLHLQIKKQVCKPAHRHWHKCFYHLCSGLHCFGCCICTLEIGVIWIDV